MSRMVSLLVVPALLAAGGGRVMGAKPGPVPASAHNLLVEAKVSGNLESYDKELRGSPDHMIYDLQHRRFVKRSQWHEYGVGFGKDLGVVPENKPAYWLAEWPSPIQANLIALSGVYPNQPQPETGWKIELRREGKWVTHDSGAGGWYNSGRYLWGGRGTKPLAFDAIRVSVFSKDDTTPLKSIHFRGEEGFSWVVARVAMIDARIQLPALPVRAGRAVQFVGAPMVGEITSWQWDFGDGKEVTGKTATHTFTSTGPHQVRVVVSDGKERATIQTRVRVLSPVEAQIAPLTAAVMAGRPVQFEGGTSVGTATGFTWDCGDGRPVAGRTITHTFAKPGIYQVKLTVSDGRYGDECRAIVRAHTAETLHVPQVFLDTDQKNEVDDQHYFGYALFSELDVLGVNSIHHGGGQEPINYAEILNVLDLAKQSGLPANREPLVFRGANERLQVPASGRWQETEPIVTEASEAILAAVRGAAPSNPVWVLPVGPATNTASAMLQARAEGLKLQGRMRIMWLGGSDSAIANEFNGGNDPWAAYVMTQCGLETWIMPAPVSGRIRMDVRTEPELYPDNPLGRYLREIVPKRSKSLYDTSCPAAVISFRLGLGWVKQVDPVTVAGPQQGYRWTKTESQTAVRVVRQIDQQAMKSDVFDTLKHNPRRLIGVAPKE